MLLCADPQIKTELVADGSVQTLEYELDIPRSSWVRSRLPTREPPLLLWHSPLHTRPRDGFLRKRKG